MFNRFTPRLSVCIACVGLSFCTRLAHADEQLERFFETKVRPLLTQHCVECHGTAEQSGELRLDRRSAVEKGGGSGPLVVPGSPQESLLMTVVGYEDLSQQMPPSGKLSAADIATLRKWVADGSYWPEEDGIDDQPSASPAERIDHFRQSHWSFQPLQAVEPPASEAWGQQPLDGFILEKLQAAELSPSPPADRRTLIQRAYFMLLGLPPTYEQIEAFAANDSPDAFERLVDELLESQHYGERWARHWLDLARYAETTGYLAGSRDTRYPYAFTYRDYVIKAFNDDKPFDQFILEQIAADQLDLPDDDRSALAAMGFLTVGRAFMNNIHDRIDDRIDVVTRGFMGLSVTCARCHDHKYDPIPAADYYSLYGVFASSEEPSELPLLGTPVPEDAHAEFIAAQAAEQQQVDQWVEEKRQEIQQQLRERVGDYLEYLAKSLPQYNAGNVPLQGTRGPLLRPAIERWKSYVGRFADQSHPVWALWHQLASLQPSEFQEQAVGISQKPEADSDFPAPLLAAFQADPPADMVEAAGHFGRYWEALFEQLQDSEQQSDETAGAKTPSSDLLASMLVSDAPTTLDFQQAIAHLDQGQRNDYNRRLQKVRALEVTHPGAPPRGMVLVDKPKPQNPVIFRRGQPGNRGDAVPRRFLQVLEQVDGGQPFVHGSGRLELGRAIASENNPLTARVIVNRIWQQHFGAGLVRTASDFGTRGESPSHPELLDYLARQFIADGWSIKRLQRTIMLSATWQQASGFRAAAHRTDPENRLLWRMPPRRLEFEPMRDRVLSVAERLDLTIGGRSVMIHQDATRRALYAYVDREDVPGLLASFDVPSPDASQAIRAETTVPQQALFLMNAKFVLDQASEVARSTAEIHSTPQRITQLFRRVLARDPSAEELRWSETFLEPESDLADTLGLTVARSLDEVELAAGAPAAAAWQFGYGYFDGATQQTHFTPLPHFTGEYWRISDTYPDPEFGYVSLGATAGHPGNASQHSVIRRWVSPLEGKVRLRGRLIHKNEQGDGVRARLVSNRQGLFHEWVAHASEVRTAVPEIQVGHGEVLDFIVDCRSGPAFDSFQWSPFIQALASESGDDLPRDSWSAKDDFLTASQQQQPRPVIDQWALLVQVLLLSNEFVFVD